MRFERLINKDGVYVIARIEFTLEKSGRPIFTRVYENTQKVTGVSIHATVEFMGKVLENIYQQLLADIKQSPH